MDNKEFVKKWATLYYVTGLREVFNNQAYGEIPKNKDIIRADYEKMVTVPMSQIGKPADYELIQQALTTSYEFVYIFPYIADKYQPMTINRLAARALEGLPVMDRLVDNVETRVTVLSGKQGTGFVTCHDGQSIMSFPDNVHFSLEDEVNPAFLEAWKDMFYTRGLRKIFHCEELGEEPTNLWEDYRQMVQEPLEIVQVKPEVIKPYLTVDSYLTYAFPYLAKHLKLADWNEILSYLGHSDSLLDYLLKNYTPMIRVLSNHKGVGIVFFAGNDPLLWMPGDHPIEVQELTTAATVNALRERAMEFSPLSPRAPLEYAKVVSPDSTMNIEHYNPETEEFVMSPIKVSDEYFPPYRIIDLITRTLPKSITENRTRRAIEYLHDLDVVDEEVERYIRLIDRPKETEPEQFIRSWANVFYVTGIKQFFGIENKLPHSSKDIRESFRLYVFFYARQCTRHCNMLALREALSSNAELVYLFPYLVTNEMWEVINQLAAGKRAADVLPSEVTRIYTVVACGSKSGHGYVYHLGTVPMMTFPDTIFVRTRGGALDYEFFRKWAEQYYGKGLQRLYHNPELYVPFDENEALIEYAKQVESAQDRITPGIRKKLLKDEFVLYAFPYLIGQFRKSDWETYANGFEMLAEAATFTVVLLRDNKGVGLRAHFRHSLIMDAPLNHLINAEEALPTDTLRVILYKTIDKLPETEAVMELARHYVPAYSYTIEHYDGSEFDVSPINIGSVWFPPYRIFQMLHSSPNSITTAEACQYLAEHGGLYPEEIDFMLKVGLKQQ